MIAEVITMIAEVITVIAEGITMIAEAITIIAEGITIIADENIRLNKYAQYKIKRIDVYRDLLLIHMI